MVDKWVDVDHENEEVTPDAQAFGAGLLANLVALLRLPVFQPPLLSLLVISPACMWQYLPCASPATCHVALTGCRGCF